MDNKVYLFGNFHRAIIPSSRSLVGVFIFDPSTYRWDMVLTESSPDNKPFYISHLSVIAYSHSAYMWGIPQGGPPEGVLFRFDTSTMNWSRPQVTGEVPTAKWEISACLVADGMYLFDAMDFSQGVWFLGLQTMKLHRVLTSGEVPVGRFFHIASAIGTCMYLWGGSTVDPLEAAHLASCNALYYLETSTSTWIRPRVEGRPPAGRMGHSAFVYNTELYIFGGYDADLDTYFADMHKYDTVTSCWTKEKPCGSGPSARAFHSCCKSGERVFIIGGCGPTPNQEEETEAEALTDLHVLHLAPTLQNLCLHAVMDGRLDISRSHIPPLIRRKINDITTNLS